MPSPGPERLAVFVAGEDRVHWFLATRLFDAALTERIGGPPGAEHRTFIGLRPGSDSYDIRHAKAHAQDAGLRLTGRIGGARRSPASIFLTRIRFLAVQAGAGAVVLLKDSDGDEAFAREARRAQDSAESELPPVAFGVPHRDAEAWLLAGWTPRDPSQHERLREATAALRFDPTRRPERLTARPNDAVTDAKRVWMYLHGEGDALEGAGRAPSRPPTVDHLEEIQLTRLRELGRFAACGLADFSERLRRLCEVVAPPGSRD
jgi:hypothetical protein